MGSPDERDVIEWIANRSAPPPPGDVWIGDDTAVLTSDQGVLLFATDSMVEGVHFLSGDRYLASAGWKALVRNVSDVAAMGGRPTHAVVSIPSSSRSTRDSKRPRAGTRAPSSEEI
jgi:thiamine-monophosphate kinase